MRIEEKHPDLLNMVDSLYWELNHQLEKALLEHINKTGIGQSYTK